MRCIPGPALGGKYFEVDIHFANPPKLGPSYMGHSPSLGYGVNLYDGKTPKLQGRYVVKPKVRREDYTVSAVIDWVELLIILDSPSNWQTVQKVVKSVSSRTDHCGAPSGYNKNSSDHLTTRLQIPDPKELRLIQKALRERYGARLLKLEVNAIEVSVDWYPKSQKDLDRWRMTEALRQHHWVVPEASSDLGEQPRSSFSKDSTNKTVFLQKPPKASMISEERVGGVLFAPNPARQRDLKLSSYNQLPIDGTYYVGAKVGLVKFRIMDKTTDRRKAEEVSDLEQKAKRSRIEATMERPFLKECGLDSVDDLFGYGFQKFRKWLFDFYYPTVGSVEEVEVFKKAGVYGLDKYQRAFLDREHETRRKKVRFELPPKAGKRGLLVSAAEINSATEKALENLSKRWSGW